MITLRPLTEADLPVVEPWFDDPETRHWLGGQGWPKGKLSLATERRHTLIASADDQAAGVVDIEISEDKRAAFAIVVAPALRRRGVGRRIIAACLADTRFAGLSEWCAGVETGNVASRRLLLDCGFARMTVEDADGFYYFARRLNGWPLLPWQPPWVAEAGPRLPWPVMRKLASAGPVEQR